jgi:hypothetical protein
MDQVGISTITPKGCLKWFFMIAALVVVLLMALPNFSWTGSAPLTIHVRVVDADSKRPVVGAKVTLHPFPPYALDQSLSRSFVRTGETDHRGRATLRHSFGAGGGTFGTEIGVRQSVVSGEAERYELTRIHLSDNGSLRFFEFPGFQRRHATKILIPLKAR